MKRLTICMFILLVTIFSLLVACTATTAEQINPFNPSSEEITDTVAKELFENAVNQIITLASEDPTLLVKMILGDNVEIIYKEKNIDGVVYYETTATFKSLHDYYSEIFTGDALDWILSTKFTDVDGTLYCSPLGGASGWIITNLEITRTGQNSGNPTYEATFNEFENTTICKFVIEKINGEYRISTLDYIPDLLRK